MKRSRALPELSHIWKGSWRREIGRGEGWVGGGVGEGEGWGEGGGEEEWRDGIKMREEVTR